MLFFTRLPLKKWQRVDPLLLNTFQLEAAKPLGLVKSPGFKLACVIRGNDDNNALGPIIEYHVQRVTVTAG